MTTDCLNSARLQPLSFLLRPVASCVCVCVWRACVALGQREEVDQVDGEKDGYGGGGGDHHPHHHDIRNRRAVTFSTTATIRSKKRKDPPPFRGMRRFRWRANEVRGAQAEQASEMLANLRNAKCRRRRTQNKFIDLLNTVVRQKKAAVTFEKLSERC